jgi:hypothetical protein
VEGLPIALTMRSMGLWFNPDRPIKMNDPRRRLAYAALAIVYTITAVILTFEQALAHASCAAAAAAIYCFLSLQRPNHHTKERINGRH